MSVFQSQLNRNSYYERKHEASTADNFYDLEEGQRRYQELVE